MARPDTRRTWRSGEQAARPAIGPILLAFPLEQPRIANAVVNGFLDSFNRHIVIPGDLFGGHGLRPHGAR